MTKDKHQESSIEKRKPQEAEEIPDYLQRAPGHGAAGFEEVEQGDLTLPRLGLCQALSPQKDEMDPKFIEGLVEGDYFNTLTNDIYGRRVQVVPLLFFKNRILFKDKKEGGGILCRSDDMKKGIGTPGGECAKCPMNAFGSAKNGTAKGKACTEFFNFPSLVVNDGKVSPQGLAVASFKSSGVPAAKDWLAKMRLREIDMFGGIYEFSAKSKKFNEGTAFVTIVNPAGNVSRETYEASKMVYSAMSELRRQGRLRVDTEGIEPDPNEGGDAREQDHQGPAPF